MHRLWTVSCTFTALSVPYCDSRSDSFRGTWHSGAAPLNGNRVLLYLLQWRRGCGPHNLILQFKLHEDKTRATCLHRTFWAPVSKFQLSCHVVYTISTQEQISLNPQGIWVTRALNEKQTWRQVLSSLLLDNELKGVFDFHKTFGREFVHKAVSLHGFW